MAAVAFGRGGDVRFRRKETDDGNVAGIAALVLIGLTFSAAAQEIPPLPPPRPDRPTVLPPLPPVREEETGKTPVEQKSPEASAPDAACLERLTRLGLRFETKPPVQDETCNVQDAVVVSALPDGVEVVPASLMRCQFAESLSRWMEKIVRPEADRRFQTAPTKILIGTSYQCRDQRSGEKLSEHAFGNAVDVMGFEFAKHPPLSIKFQAEGSSEEAFQTTIQKSACPIFNTVLGPGAEDHSDHLHLDLRARKGDYRICQ